jgi:polyhydroxybutyrate depolymerase
MSDTLPPRRWPALAAVLALINLPGAMAIGEAVAFRASHGSTDFVTVAGQKRGYRLHVPDGLDPARPAPLVIVLHGAGLWGGAMRDITGWDQVADREGLVVAYPGGGVRGSSRVWGPTPGPRLERDVEFIGRMIDTLAATLPIDTGRVYVNGLSNGAGFAFALSCLLPRRVAAVGMVGAAITLPVDLCDDAPPVPLVVFHGTADPASPYHGGRTWVAPRPFPDIPDWVATRAAVRNRCAGEPADSAVSPDVTRRAWARCAGGAAVVLYTVDGGGHSWPGGRSVPAWLLGATSRGVDATAEMWAFFGVERNLRPGRSR